MPTELTAAEVEKEVPEVEEFASSATIELFEDGVISFVEEVEVNNGDVEENTVIKQPENIANSSITLVHDDLGNQIDFVESRKTVEVVIVADDIEKFKVSNVVMEQEVAKDPANPNSVLEDLGNILDGLKAKIPAIAVKEEPEAVENVVDSSEIIGDSTKTVMDKLWQLDDEEEEGENSKKELEGLNVNDVKKYKREGNDAVEKIGNVIIALQEVDELKPLCDMNESVQIQEGKDDDSRHQCDKCDFKALREIGLLLHRKSKHKEERILCVRKCKSCDFTSKYSNTIRRHFKSIHIEGKTPVWKIRRGLVEGGERRRRRCAKCSYVTCSRANYKHHIENEHIESDMRLKKDGERWIKINKNREEQVRKFEHIEGFEFPENGHGKPEEFKPLLELNAEVKTEEGEEDKKINLVKFGCNLCTNHYSTHGEIDQHMKDAHENSQEEPLIQVKVEHENHEGKDQMIESFNCKQCLIQFSTQGEVELHMQSAHENSLFQCGKCDYQPTTADDYLHHRSLHKRAITARLEKCKSCDYTSPHKSTIRRHFKSIHIDGNTPLKRRKCTMCAHTTRSRVNLRNHIQSVHAEGLYSTNELDPMNVPAMMIFCQDCDFKTNDREILMKHIKNNHTRGKVAELVTEMKQGLVLGTLTRCKDCEFETIYGASLLKHIQITHSGQNVAEVETDKQPNFTESEMNSEDSKIDPKKLKFCQECDYDTTNRGHLRQHIENVHSEKPIVKRTELKSLVLLHCSGCDYSTYRHNSIKRHFKSIHIEGKHPVWKMRRENLAMKAANKSRRTLKDTRKSTITSNDTNESTITSNDTNESTITSNDTNESRVASKDTSEFKITPKETSELGVAPEEQSKSAVTFKSESSEKVEQEINHDGEEDLCDPEAQARSWSHFLLGELVPSDPLEVVSNISKILSPPGPTTRLEENPVLEISSNCSNTSGVPDSPAGFRCSVCGKYSKDKKSLYQHVSDHVKKYPCDGCSSIFARKYDVKRHRLRAHK